VRLLDAGSDATALSACGALRVAGCAEGFDPDCETVFEQARGFVDLHEKCLLDGHSPRVCGSSCTRDAGASVPLHVRPKRRAR
jgi:hypothetical protein